MNIALVLSGGIGSRLVSDIPKQYIKVNNRTILSYCIETLSKSDRIDAIWIVAAEKWQQFVKGEISHFDVNSKFQGFSEPGENRQLSIYNGICDIRQWLLSTDKKTVTDEELVFIHDAARPLLTRSDISHYVDAIEGHDGVLPVLPMKDTVYFSDDGLVVTELLERSKIYAGQAPEVFRLNKYIEANERLIHYEGECIGRNSEILKINGSTEPAIKAGMDIVMVPGNEGNFKITTAEDLTRFQMLVE